MRIAVVADTHANLPALEAALQFSSRAGAERLYHVGDVVGLGPHPREVLGRLLEHPRAHLVMGNHDALLAHGLSVPPPVGMGQGEAEHHRWTREQVPADLWRTVVRWPYQDQLELGPTRVVFQHYGLTPAGNDFVPIIRDPAPGDLDRLFPEGDLVLYGHDHRAGDQHGRGRYVNPGSLGCAPGPVAQLVLLTLADDGTLDLSRHAVPYDGLEVLRDLEYRRVPDREFIGRVFFGGLAR